MSLATWFPPIPSLTSNAIGLANPGVQTGGGQPTAGKSPLLGTVWGYPGDTMDKGPTAWGDWLDLKSEQWRNLIGVSLPTEGPHAVPLSTVPLGGLVRVTSSQTGQSITVPRIDKGPAAWTGNGVDLTWNAARALSLDPKEGRFAGLYVEPTGKAIQKSQLGNFVYTGAMRIEPTATDLMKEPGMSTPINLPGGGWANNIFAPSAPGAAPAWQKIAVGVGYGLTMLVLVVALLKDQPPTQVINDGVNSIGKKAKQAAEIAAGA